MGKSIDLTKPLSAEDRAWLEERGATGDLRVADELARYAAGSPADDSPVEPTVLQENDEAENAAAAEETEAEDTDGDSGDAGDDGDEAGGLYGDWSKAQLQYELGQRDLPQSGTKVELVERLEAADKDAEQE